MADLNQEIWTDVLVEDFNTTEEASFLGEIPDESRFVSATTGDNEVIHLVDVGADPDVLINNSTYPLGITEQTDKDIPILLDKYQTTATPITLDEMQYIRYDKIRLVQKKHKGAVMRTKHAKATHALAPDVDSVTTPVIETSGDVDPVTGLKKLRKADILSLKRKFDAQKIPLQGRILVLSSDHYNDLLEHENTFANQISDEKTGMLNKKIYGFKVYEYVATPYFSKTTKQKLAFAAVPTADHFQASVAFYAPDMFRASGSSQNFVDKPSTQTQRWMFNVRHNYIVLPKKKRAIGAIVSVA
ncbi:MAG: hypothetical protein ACPG6V_05255 [Flavobacteriales bacterium]